MGCDSQAVNERTHSLSLSLSLVSVLHWVLWEVLLPRPASQPQNTQRMWLSDEQCGAVPRSLRPRLSESYSSSFSCSNSYYWISLIWLRDFIVWKYLNAAGVKNGRTNRLCYRYSQLWNTKPRNLELTVEFRHHGLGSGRGSHGWTTRRQQGETSFSTGSFGRFLSLPFRFEINSLKWNSR